MMYYSSNPSPSRCTAVTGSMTMALKAQRLLSKYALRTEVIKVGKTSAKQGCSYGIEYDCAISGNVRQILTDNAIEIKEYLR